MQRDLLLLHEMIDAAEQAQRLVTGHTADELTADRMRRESLLWNFTVLGWMPKRSARSTTESPPRYPVTSSSI